MGQSEVNYHDVHMVVSRMTQAVVQDEHNLGTGYAAATGTLQAYLTEAIAELPAARRAHWHRTLSQRAQEIEQNMIMKRLSQEETHE